MAPLSSLNVPLYSLLTSDQYQSNSGVEVLGTCLINYNIMSINSKMWTNKYNTVKNEAVKVYLPVISVHIV